MTQISAKLSFYDQHFPESITAFGEVFMFVSACRVFFRKKICHHLRAYDDFGNFAPRKKTEMIPEEMFIYDTDCTDEPMFDRGYTMHEHYDAFGLINQLRYTDPSGYVTTIPPEFKTYYYPELIGDYESYMRKWWKTRRI